MFDKFDVFEDQCIGSGGEARVFRGEWAQIDVAVRRIFLGPVSQVERDRRFLQFKSEVRLMKQLVHPSIASFFGCSLHRSHFYMILELGSCSMRDAVVYHQQHGRGSSLAERLSGSLLDFSGGAGGARCDDGDAAPSPPPPRLELRIALRWALEVAEGMLYVVSFSQCGVSIACARRTLLLDPGADVCVPFSHPAGDGRCHVKSRLATARLAGTSTRRSRSRTSI